MDFIVEKHHRALGVGGVLFIDFIWGSSFVMMKNAMESISTLALLSVRFALAALLLWLLLGKKRTLLNKAALKAGFFIGIPLTLGYYLQNLGLTMTTASGSAMITGTYVVFIPLISWFITRQLNRLNLLLGVLTLLCLGLFSYTGELGMLQGDLLVLASAFFYAAHFLTLDHYVAKFDIQLLTTLQITTVAILCIIATLLSEGLPAASAFTGQVWWTLAYTAVLGTALAFSVQTAAQRVLPPATISVLFTGESLFGALAGAFFLHETFTPQQLIGGLGMIICMVAAVLISQKRPTSREVSI